MTRLRLIVAFAFEAIFAALSARGFVFARGGRLRDQLGVGCDSEDEVAAPAVAAHPSQVPAPRELVARVGVVTFAERLRHISMPSEALSLRPQLIHGEPAHGDAVLGAFLRGEPGRTPKHLPPMVVQPLLARLFGEAVVLEAEMRPLRIRRSVPRSVLVSDALDSRIRVMGVVARRATAVHDRIVHGRVRAAILRLVVEETGDVFGRRDLFRELLVVNDDAYRRAAWSSGGVVRRL